MSRYWEEEYDSTTLPDFWATRYCKDSQKNWDLFYRRNEARFFRDRHWLARELPELATAGDSAVFFEIGCGVGNLLLPLMESQPDFRHYYGSDFACRAVALLQKVVRDKEIAKCTIFEWDITSRCPLKDFSGADIATLVFVLSAIPPANQGLAVSNIALSVKQGGILFFRDYTKDDGAEKRFKPRSRLGDSWFVRQDGTLSYFFHTDEVRRLFPESIWEVVELRTVTSQTSNKREGLSIDRRFIQGRFRRR